MESSMDTPCLEYEGCKTKSGYGVKGKGGHWEYAHRVAYAESRGIHMRKLDGKVIRHLCDNPGCINPEHLVEGTHADNSQDKVARGRQAKGEDFSSSKLSEEAVLDIRQNYVKRSKEYSLKYFSDKYGCSIKVIHDVITGKTWRHIK